jgi:hypothetical protein
MSSHNIFVECRVCWVSNSISTQHADLEDFQNDSYEGECVEAICDKCDTKGGKNVE